MTGPYQTVTTSIAASSILVAGLLFYKFIYPKKNPNLFILLIFTSMLPVISIFRPGVYESGDFNLHIYRAIAFYDALKDGQLIPSWPRDLNASYGYPLFLFNYNFPYYILSFFHFIGFSFITGMKLFLASSFMTSGIFMYLWIKNEFKNKLAAFSSAIFYLFSPYHLVDLHFRATIGELTVFALLPLVLFFIQKFITVKNKIYLLYIIVIFSFIILAHAGTGMFSLSIILPYIVYSAWSDKKPRMIIYLSTSLLLGIALSSFLILPYVFYLKYTLAGALTATIVSFVSIPDLLYSPFRFGFLFQGSRGELSFIIGYTQILIILLALRLYFKKFKRSKFNSTGLWLALAFLLIFLITPFSLPVWKTFSFLNIVQFSYRLNLLLTICVSVLAGIYTISNLKKPLVIYCILLITISYTMLNWGNRKVISSINDSFLVNNLPKSTSEGEGFCCAGSPIWTDTNHPWFNTIPKEHLNITEGQAEWKTINRTSIQHDYIIFAKTPIKIKENTEYFPGWTASDNRQKLLLNISTTYPKGVMEFTLSRGLHFIQIRYEDILPLKLSKIISITGMTAIILIIITYHTNSFLKRRRIIR